MLSSAPALRNRGAILEVLQRHLPAKGAVLEIASGSGEHVTHFAAALPDLVFQPSDPNADARASIAARIEHEKLKNVREPLNLDAAAEEWRIPSDIAGSLAAILCINMIHASPWRAALGLLRGAGNALRPQSLLYLYGPYRRAGRMAPSNEEFDRGYLRARDPEWGIRNLEDVLAEAAARQLALAEIIEMPANNLSVLLRRM